MQGVAAEPAAEPQQEVYGYGDSYESCAKGYLMPAVEAALARLPANAEIFELGCGAGDDAAHLTGLGYRVTGVDASRSGIAIAQQRHPGVRFEVATAEEDLAARFGQFDVVLSLEVIEHVFSPRAYARSVAALLKPGGIAIISTPYHGYFKNLALAVTNKMDAHFTVLWEGGHIKFWSRKTLDTLFAQVGMRPAGFARVGRIPALAKSMVAVYAKPAETTHV